MRGSAPIGSVPVGDRPGGAGGDARAAPAAGEVRGAPSAARVAIFTDETGWHTRRLRQALARRGFEGRCVDLADCRFDTTAMPHGLVIPGFGRSLPRAALVRGIAGGSLEQITKRLGILHALRELGVPSTTTPAPSSAASTRP